MARGRVAALLVLVVLPVTAEPSELPPAGYAGAQYVDSTGCVFRRDGGGGWQARLTRDGNPLCGYAPSLAGAASAAPAQQDAAVMIVEALTVPGALTNCPNQPATAQRYRLSDGRVVMRCSAQVGDPVGFINGAGVPGLHVAGIAPEAEPLPATGKMGVLLDLALRNPLPDAPARPRAVRKAAPAKGERFVQIGAFGDPDNARKVKERIRALGLPVAVSTAKRGGRKLELIFSGPFDAEGAACALDTLRGGGFKDAIIR